jgi:hypothetical protein
MLDDGKIHYTLGNGILHNHKKGWTILHQEWYLVSKLQEFHMFNCNSFSTPMQPKTQLSTNDFPNTLAMQVIMDIYPHSKIVGILMHSIVNSWLNCAYAINNLAQYFSNLGDTHI